MFNNLLLISTSCSTVNSKPLIGSVLFSLMYFSISRLSKIDPDTGETTGCSGTSLETVNVIKYVPTYNICYLYFSLYRLNLSLNTQFKL